jgi:hypothetical protein
MAHELRASLVIPSCEKQRVKCKHQQYCDSGTLIARGTDLQG